MNYKLKDQFVFRTHLIPFKTTQKLRVQNKTDKESFLKYLSTPLVREALLLASPDLCEELRKWTAGQIKNRKDENRVAESVYKYLARMSSRCTPFGLFAGCALGDFSSSTDIKLSQPEHFFRHTRLDMHFLGALAADLDKNHEIRNYLTYSQNTSIYQVYSDLRYTEYRYVNGGRQYFIMEVENNEYIEKLLDAAKNGISFKGLISLLVDDDISVEEATDFIHELIDSQLLVSNLESSVTGDEFLDQLISELPDDESCVKVKSDLISLKEKLNSIDAEPIGDTLSSYGEIEADVKSMGTIYKPNQLFQTDLKINAKSCRLDSKLKDEIVEALVVLNRLTPRSNENLLKQFKEAFYERYEEAELPLLEVLDTEMGIGFKQDRNSFSNDIAPLVDDLFFSGNAAESGQSKLNWHPVYSILQKKLNESIAHASHEIVIDDRDLKGLNAPDDDLPSSFSSMLEIYKQDDKYKVFMDSAGGTSAANLLGRFCQSDELMKTYVSEITLNEERHDASAVLAEIVHVPEARMGNILQRPNLRKYEIPYLGRSTVKTEYQFMPSDILISVPRGSNVTLRSKITGQKILPRMATAHNFSNNALPVYEFLCSLQSENKQSGVGFGWGPLEQFHSYFPRVRYKNVILAYAKWIIRKEDFFAIEIKATDNEVLRACNEWRKKLNLPLEVLFVDGDNDLYVNLENILSIKAWFALVKKRSSFILKEFYFTTENSIVKGADGKHRNQIVVCFEKEVLAN